MCGRHEWQLIEVPFNQFLDDAGLCLIDSRKTFHRKTVHILSKYAYIHAPHTESRDYQIKVARSGFGV